MGGNKPKAKYRMVAKINIIIVNPTNVYRSALSDDVNHRHGRLGSSYTKGTLSDWS
jgi:hypothetical protein